MTTAKRKHRWRGDREVILDGSRLGFELWYRFLLAAKEQGEAINYRLYSDWSLVKDSRDKEGELVKRGFERTLEKYNAGQWSYRMFGTTRKASSKWHKTFGVERVKAVEQISPGGLSNDKIKQIETEGDALVRVSIAGRSREDIDKSFDEWLVAHMDSQGRGRGKSIGRTQRAAFHLELFSDRQVQALKRALAVHETIVKRNKSGLAKLNVAQYYGATGNKFDEFKLDGARSNLGRVQRLFGRDRQRAGRLINGVCSGRFDSK
jgi:hypothetical protein